MYLLALSVSQKLKGAYKEKEAGNGPFKKIKGRNLCMKPISILAQKDQ